MNKFIIVAALTLAIPQVIPNIKQYVNISGTTNGPITVTNAGSLTPPAVVIPNGTNAEQLIASWNSNTAEVGVLTNGGTARHFRLRNDGAGVGILINTNGSDRWFFDNAGDLETGSAHIVDPVPSVAPTVASGFGTSPSIAGTGFAFRVTEGTPVGTSGVVNFNSTFTNAPICSCHDETTVTAGCTPTASTTQVTLTQAYGTIVAADKLVVLCRGF